MATAKNSMFSFQVDGLSSDLAVLKLDGEEAISALFQFELTLVSPDAIAFSDVVGKSATIGFLGPQAPERFAHGIVSRFEHTHDGRKHSYYRLTLVPKLWRLQHRHDSRIFQGKTVPDIVKEVLQGASLAEGDDFEMKATGNYSPREYCVQYRESDFAFVSRLLEEEGIFYFFKHSDGHHVLVISDEAKSHEPIPDPSSVPFFASVDGTAPPDAVMRLSTAEEVRPGKVSLGDWNFKKPSLSLAAESQGKKDTDLEIYDAPHEYSLPADGTKLSKIRLEELERPRVVASGASGCKRFIAGYVFTLTDHTRDASNRGYLLTRVVHAATDQHQFDGGGERAHYSNQFVAIPDDVAFRPERRTPRPTVKGSQTAIVTGAGGEEIHTDEHGRVKVHFHWDRKGSKDDKSSCWIRVSQLWAGAGYGAMYIPRVGHEVIVDFLEGDPDQPIIVGRVYHGANVPPYPLPAEKTKSTIRTNSSPGGGGSNELRFEDKAGSEEIYLHGQKDYNIKIEHDKNQKIGHDETLDVVHDKTIHIGHDRTKTVDNDQFETIGGNKTIDVAKDHKETIHQNESLTVGGNETIKIAGHQKVTIDKTRTEDILLAHTETIGLAQTSSVGGMWNKSVGAAMTLSVGLKKSESVGGSSTESVGSDKTVTVGGAASETIAKDKEIIVQKKMSLTVHEDYVETIQKNRKSEVTESVEVHCGDVKVTVKKDGTISIEGKDLSVKGTGTLKVEAKKIEMKSDGAIDLKASGDVIVKGGSVKLN
ncbi:MAG: type VI secretion system tip protein TssI/VgrG [Polyangiaceae bacterium]